MEAAMAQVLVRNIDEAAIRRLKSRAARKGHSLEQELRLVIVEASRDDHQDFWQEAARIKASLNDRQFSDSTALIREDRDR
jgi:plasmid stability protein